MRTFRFKDKKYYLTDLTPKIAQEIYDIWNIDGLTISLFGNLFRSNSMYIRNDQMRVWHGDLKWRHVLKKSGKKFLIKYGYARSSENNLTAWEFMRL